MRKRRSCRSYRSRSPTSSAAPTMAHGWCSRFDQSDRSVRPTRYRCGCRVLASSPEPPKRPPPTRRLRRRVGPVGRLSRHAAPVDRTNQQGCRRSSCHCTSCWPPSLSHRRCHLRSSARPTTHPPACPSFCQGTPIREVWPSSTRHRLTGGRRSRPPSSPWRGEASRTGRTLSTPGS